MALGHKFLYEFQVTVLDCVWERAGLGLFASATFIVTPSFAPLAGAATDDRRRFRLGIPQRHVVSVDLPFNIIAAVADEFAYGPVAYGACLFFGNMWFEHALDPFRFS